MCTGIPKLVRIPEVVDNSSGTTEPKVVTPIERNTCARNSLEEPIVVI